MVPIPRTRCVMFAMIVYSPLLGIMCSAFTSYLQAIPFHVHVTGFGSIFKAYCKRINNSFAIYWILRFIGVSGYIGLRAVFIGAIC